MAGNRIYYPAHHLSLPVSAGTKSGDPVMVGVMPGVAQTDRDADGRAAVGLEGAYALEVEATSGDIEAGAPIYLSGGGDLTNDPTSGPLFGVAVSVPTAFQGGQEVPSPLLDNGQTAEIGVKLAGITGSAEAS